MTNYNIYKIEDQSASLVEVKSFNSDTEVINYVSNLVILTGYHYTVELKTGNISEVIY
jgi:hypothetical protein